MLKPIPVSTLAKFAANPEYFAAYRHKNGAGARQAFACMRPWRHLAEADPGCGAGCCLRPSDSSSLSLSRDSEPAVLGVPHHRGDSRRRLRDHLPRHEPPAVLGPTGAALGPRSRNRQRRRERPRPTPLLEADGRRRPLRRSRRHLPDETNGHHRHRRGQEPPLPRHDHALRAPPGDALPRHGDAPLPSSRHGDHPLRQRTARAAGVRQEPLPLVSASSC